MHPREIAFVMAESARLRRENVREDGWPMPPTYEQIAEIVKRGTALCPWYVRLFRRWRAR